MKFANVVVVGLVVLGTFGLVFACQVVLSIDFLQTAGGDVMVGASCSGLNQETNEEACRRTRLACRTKYYWWPGGGGWINLPDGCEGPEWHESCPKETEFKVGTVTENYEYNGNVPCAAKYSYGDCVTDWALDLCWPGAALPRVSCGQKSTTRKAC